MPGCLVGGNGGMCSVGVGFSELEVLSIGPLAITLCRWIQSETCNTMEKRVSVLHSMDHKNVY